MCTGFLVLQANISADVLKSEPHKDVGQCCHRIVTSAAKAFQLTVETRDTAVGMRLHLVNIPSPAVHSSWPSLSGGRWPSRNGVRVIGTSRGWPNSPCDRYCLCRQPCELLPFCVQFWQIWCAATAVKPPNRKLLLPVFGTEEGKRVKYLGLNRSFLLFTILSTLVP